MKNRDKFEVFYNSEKPFKEELEWVFSFKKICFKMKNYFFNLFLPFVMKDHRGKDTNIHLVCSKC